MCLVVIRPHKIENKLCVMRYKIIESLNHERRF